MTLSEEQLAAFERNGYVTVKGLFSTRQVAAMHGSTGNITPSTRTIAYLNVNSTENAITKFGRAEYFGNRDFSPLQPHGDDCLMQQEAA